MTEQSKSKQFQDTLEEITSDPKLHTSHLYVLSRMSQADLQTFQNIWPTMPATRRRDIVRELTEISEVNFEVYFDPVFLLGLGDTDPEVRKFSIRGLWEHEHPALIRPLIHLLQNDEAAIVREAAASALGKFIYLRELEEIDPAEASLAEEALLETIYQGQETIDVRRRAIEAVSYSSDARIPPIIETAYYSSEDKMQVSAIFAMGRNADARWLSIVITELENPNSEIRFEACRACGELEARDAVKQLIHIINEDTDPEVQEVAVWTLGRIGGQLAREALEICLEHEQETLVIAAEAALDEINLFDDALMLFNFDEFNDDDPANFGDLLNGNGNGPTNTPRLGDYLN